MKSAVGDIDRASKDSTEADDAVCDSLNAAKGVAISSSLDGMQSHM